MGIVVVIVLILLAAYVVYGQVVAHRQLSATTTKSPEQVQQIVLQHFRGPHWQKGTQGAQKTSAVSRWRVGGPTLHVESQRSGSSTTVTLYAADYFKIGGLNNHATAANRHLRRLRKKIEAA